MSASILRILNQPGWNYKISHQGVSIFAPTKHDAIYIAQSYGDAFSETAFKINGKVRIRWQGCKQPIEFFAWMAGKQAPTPSQTAERILQYQGAVFCSQLHIPSQLLHRMIAAAENERPVSIVRQDTRKQIIVNQPMAEMLQTPAEISTKRIMTQFWLPEDLAELEKRLHNDRQFTWTYSAGLNEQAWAILTTQFEAFEVEGVWYRQGICLSTPQLVSIPPGVFEPA